MSNLQRPFSFSALFSLSLCLYGTALAGCANDTTSPVGPAAVDVAEAVQPLRFPSLLAFRSQATLGDTTPVKNAYFGKSLAMSGNTLVVGEPDVGAVTVFLRSGSSWTQQARLTPTSGTGDTFGARLALSGDTLLIGAPDADPSTLSDAGEAYVFTRSGVTWTLQATLVAADAAASAGFGNGVALVGDNALVGSSARLGMLDSAGAAYVFVRSGTTWTQQAKLTASDASNRQFFSSGAVSLSATGDTALVGALQSPITGAGVAGAAYVFQRSGTTWTQESKLVSSDISYLDYLGAAVALSGDGLRALVGAPGQNGVASDAGAAYVFERSGTTWTQTARLGSTAPLTTDFLGYSVALGDDYALLGLPYATVSTSSRAGKALVFARSGTTWTQHSVLAAPTTTAAENVGWSVALGSDYTAVVGAPGATRSGTTGAGAAYVFVAATVYPNGTMCTKSDDCQSGYCTDGVCCNTECGLAGPSTCRVCSTAKGAAVDGTCSAAPDGTVCRAASGVCDAPDVCKIFFGFGSCTSVVKPAGTSCRPSAGLCDPAETCDGFVSDCPPDKLAPAATVCRAAAGLCDVAEKCSGTQAACPGDGFVAAATVCRAAAGDCDVAEKCSGSTADCPTDSLAPTTKVCRNASGPCDAAESCSGSSTDCPADQLAPTTAVCRPASGPCDAPEYCSGASPGCPQEVPVNLCTGAGPDLSVALTAIPPALLPGAAGAVAVTVRSAGPVAAPAVTLRLDAQPGLTLDVGPSDQEGFTCVATPSNLTCTRAELAAGASATLTVVVRATAAIGTFSLAATVAAATADANPTNNTALLSVVVGGSEVPGGCAYTRSHAPVFPYTLLLLAGLLVFVQRARRRLGTR